MGRRGPEPVVSAERFERFVDRSPEHGGCWLWTGAVDPRGYGRFREGGRAGSTVAAHRFAYEQWVGPIPAGLHLDHVHALGCRHHNCVNPAHLEPVTNAENHRRAAEVRTCCAKGHPYDEANTRWSAKGRVCRTCHRDVERIRKQRARAEARESRTTL